MSSNSSYQERLSHHEQNKRVRRGTIDKLKKQLFKDELNQNAKQKQVNNAKTSNHSQRKKFKIRSQSPYKRKSPQKPKIFSFEDDDDGDEPLPSRSPNIKKQTLSVDGISYSLSSPRNGDNKMIVFGSNNVINEHQQFVQNNSINLHFNSNVSSPKQQRHLHRNKNHHHRYASASTADTYISADDEAELSEWYKFLVSVHEHLSVHIQYFPLIEQEIPFCYDEDVNDAHATERTLICQMKYWIERYGVTAMVAHQEVFKLKQDLIKINEEANNLEDESVHLTQKVFTLEYELGELLKQMKEMYALNSRYKAQIDNLKNSIAIPPPPPIQHSATSPIKIKQSFSPQSSQGDATPPPPNMDHVYRQKSSPATQPKHFPPKKPKLVKKNKKKSKTIMSFDSQSNDMNYRMKSLQMEASIESNDDNAQYEEMQSANEQLLKEKDALNSELDEIKNKNALLDETNVSLQTEVMELRKLLLRNDISIDLKAPKKKKQSKDVNEDLKEVIQTMSQQKYFWEAEKSKLKQEVNALSERLKLCNCTAAAKDLEKKVLNNAQSRKRDESFAKRLTQFGDSRDLEDVVAAMKDDDVVKAMKNDEHINRVQIGSFAQTLNKFVDHDVGSLDAVLNDMHSPDLEAQVSIKTDVSLNETEISRLKYMEVDGEESE